MNPVEPIDLAFLRAQTFDDRALEADLLELFIAQADDVRVGLFPNTSPDGDRAATLHRIKGSARAIGAGPLAAAAEQAEAALRAGGGIGPETGPALQRLAAALANACAFAASRLGAIRHGGLAKRPESR